MRVDWLFREVDLLTGEAKAQKRREIRKAIERLDHLKADAEATHIALAMHLLVELVTERGTDVLDARERKLPVSVEGDRMGVVVVSRPIDDGCALTALEMRVMHAI